MTEFGGGMGDEAYRPSSTESAQLHVPAEGDCHESSLLEVHTTSNDDRTDDAKFDEFTTLNEDENHDQNQRIEGSEHGLDAERQIRVEEDYDESNSHEAHTASNNNQADYHALNELTKMNNDQNQHTEGSKYVHDTDHQIRANDGHHEFNPREVHAPSNDDYANYDTINEFTTSNNDQNQHTGRPEDVHRAEHHSAFTDASRVPQQHPWGEQAQNYQEEIRDGNNVVKTELELENTSWTDRGSHTGQALELGAQQLDDSGMDGLRYGDLDRASEPMIDQAMDDRSDDAELRILSEIMKDRAEEKGTTETFEGATNRHIKKEPAFDEEQPTQVLRQTMGSPPAEMATEGSAKPQQLSQSAIMDHYSVEAMNNADVRDQRIPPEITSSTVDRVPSIPSTLKVEQNQDQSQQHAGNHEHRLEGDSMTHLIPRNNANVQQYHQQQAQHQTSLEGMGHHRPHTMHERGLQSQMRTKGLSTPTITGSPAYSSNVQTGDPRRIGVGSIKQESARPMSRNEMYNMNQSSQAPIPTAESPWSHNSDAHNNRPQNSLRHQVQTGLISGRFQAPDTCNATEKLHIKHQPTRFTDSHHQTPTAMNHNYQPGSRNPVPTRQNTIAASTAQKNNTMPGAPLYGNQVRPSGNNFSSPATNLHAPDYGYYGIGPSGQPVMPSAPPNGPSPWQQLMTDPNYANFYHQQQWYNRAQMAISQPLQQRQQPFSTAPQHGYPTSAHASGSNPPNPYMTPQYVGQRKTQEKVSGKEYEDDEGSSDDDEPLQSRAQRHSSLNNRHGARDSVLKRRFEHGGHNQQTLNHNHEHIQQMSFPPKQKLTIKMPATKAPTPEAQPAWKKVDPLPRPLPQPKPQSLPPSKDNEDTGEISWKLPTYAIEPQPTEPETDQPSVKVSIPGMVREVVLLSPDHATQEIHLLQNLFLPGQQELSTPDPSPYIATLNFHTVAVMVLDAYTSFEAGDTLPSLRRDDTASDSDEDLEPQNDARDADIDEIFLAAIDRWRAGKASNKKSYDLIRGVQEFCDIALDIVYYIHEHGLLREEDPDRVRKPRKDKGVKRGPRSQKAEPEVVGKKRGGRAKESVAGGTKRGAKAIGAASGRSKVNMLPARKKAKTEKEAGGGIVVMRKPRGKGT